VLLGWFLLSSVRCQRSGRPRRARGAALRHYIAQSIAWCCPRKRHHRHHLSLSRSRALSAARQQIVLVGQRNCSIARERQQLPSCLWQQPQAVRVCVCVCVSVCVRERELTKILYSKANRARFSMGDPRPSLKIDSGNPAVLRCMLGSRAAPLSAWL
jgi:hypothetical protein